LRTVIFEYCIVDCGGVGSVIVKLVGIPNALTYSHD